MIFTLAAKEARTLYGSPFAWIVLAVLQVILARLFLLRVDDFLRAQPQLALYANAPGVTEAIGSYLFSSAATVLLMATPFFTMRLVAGERRNQTLTFLISAPVSMTEIVLGKFLGLMSFLLTIVLLILAMALSLYAGAPIDLGLIASNLLGLALLAGCYAALGLYLSCLTRHAILAGIGTLGALLALWILHLTATDPGSPLIALSLLKHFESLSAGLIDTFDLAYFVLFIATFLMLAIRRLDGDRLRG